MAKDNFVHSRASNLPVRLHKLFKTVDSVDLTPVTCVSTLHHMRLSGLNCRELIREIDDCIAVVITCLRTNE